MRMKTSPTTSALASSSSAPARRRAKIGAALVLGRIGDRVVVDAGGRDHRRGGSGER